MVTPPQRSNFVKKNLVKYVRSISFGEIVFSSEEALTGHLTIPEEMFSLYQPYFRDCIVKLYYA